MKLMLVHISLLIIFVLQSCTKKSDDINAPGRSKQQLISNTGLNTSGQLAQSDTDSTPACEEKEDPKECMKCFGEASGGSISCENANKCFDVPPFPKPGDKNYTERCECKPLDGPKECRRFGPMPGGWCTSDPDNPGDPIECEDYSLPGGCPQPGPNSQSCPSGYQCPVGDAKWPIDVFPKGDPDAGQGATQIYCTGRATL
jgi:hypothetical protein